jgi:hypothetical protein
MLLVSGSSKCLGRLSGEKHLGRLIRPGNGTRPDSMPWAADNGAFKGFDEKAYRAMLGRIEGVPGCQWVTAPDVVADAEATRALFDEWEPQLRALGFPVALVAQDGLTIDAVPWERIDCIFLGGSTSWKLGPEAESIARETKRRGKLLHMGRVNTIRRMRIALEWGCDSVDGTKFSWFPDTWIPWAVDVLDGLHRQEVFSWQ